MKKTYKIRLRNSAHPAGIRNIRIGQGKNGILFLNTNYREVKLGQAELEIVESDKYFQIEYPKPVAEPEKDIRVEVGIPKKDASKAQKRALKKKSAKK